MLRRQGIVQGDTLLVHSSFDAFEGFTGKPTDVIAVLQQSVGEQGVLMMPTMGFSGSAVDHAAANPLFDVKRSPSRMGLLTELFRRSPGVTRSIHPTHPVALWGSDAASVAAGHHLARTPCGQGTPFDTLRLRQGKILLLGASIESLTFYHCLEEFFEGQLPLSPFTKKVFSLRSKAWDGEILETHCRLFEPVVSRHRNLRKLIPPLRRLGAWNETRVGRLRVTVLTAADIERAMHDMIQQHIYCYD